MQIPPIDRILNSNDIKAVRYAEKTISDLISNIRDQLYQKDQSEAVTNMLKTFYSCLSNELERITEHRETLEYEQGCSICGAQSGEDCRKFDEIGCCPSWEKCREENIF